MTPVTNRIIYPEGDILEIEHKLRINQIVDLNGLPLGLPLPTSKMIAYRVSKIQTQSTRREEVTDYFLELLDRFDLEEVAEE
ncbi:MAG: hypothetical protein JW969_03570 [Spirochaetales bacterium]|nr:hypothetical protein [Spirochaetales bacterium]